MKSYKYIIFTQIIFGLIVLTLFSCTGFNKLLKSNDTDAKYNEGVHQYHIKKYNKALTLFQNVMPNLAGSAKEDTLLFYIGKSLYNIKDYVTANEAFNTYRDRFSRTKFTQEAEYLYAMSFYRLSPSAENEQTFTKRAIVAFNEYLNRYPASQEEESIHDIIDELTNKLYYKTYLNASLYHKLGRYNGSIVALKIAIKEFPEIPYREEMMYLICKSGFEYAKNSVFERQLDRYLKMIDSYYNYISEYPDSQTFRKELDDMLKKAQEFKDKYGVEAQEFEKETTSIKERRQIIEESKNKLFETDSKAEVKELRKIIKEEKLAIKQAKEKTKEQKQQLKLEQELIN